MADKIWWSASAKGFFFQKPTDGVEITAEYRSELLLGEFNGKVISSDADGYPILIEPPPPSEAQQSIAQSAKLQSLMQEAEAQKAALTARIGVLNEAVEYEIATDNEKNELQIRIQQRKDWGQYAVYLGRVKDQAGWPFDVDWPKKPEQRIDQLASSVANSSTAS